MGILSSIGSSIAKAAKKTSSQGGILTRIGSSLVGGRARGFLNRFARGDPSIILGNHFGVHGESIFSAFGNTDSSLDRLQKASSNLKKSLSSRQSKDKVFYSQTLFTQQEGESKKDFEARRTKEMYEAIARDSSNRDANVEELAQAVAAGLDYTIAQAKKEKEAKNQQNSLPPERDEDDADEEKEDTSVGFGEDKEESLISSLMKGGISAAFGALTPIILPLFYLFRRGFNWIVDNFDAIKYSINHGLRMVKEFPSTVGEMLGDGFDWVVTKVRSYLPTWMGGLTDEEVQQHEAERATEKEARKQKKARKWRLQDEAQGRQDSPLGVRGENAGQVGGFTDTQDLDKVRDEAVDESIDYTEELDSIVTVTQALMEQLKEFGAYDDSGELISGKDIDSFSEEDLDRLLDIKFQLYGEKYRKMLGDISTLNKNEKAYLLRLPAPVIYFTEDGKVDKDKTHNDLYPKYMRLASAFNLRKNKDGTFARIISQDNGYQRIRLSGELENKFDALSQNSDFSLTKISSDDELYDRYLQYALLNNTETPWGIADEQVIVHDGIPYRISTAKGTATGISEGQTASISEASIEEEPAAQAEQVAEASIATEEIGQEESQQQVASQAAIETVSNKLDKVEESSKKSAAIKQPPQVINNNTVLPSEKTVEVRYVTDNYNGSNADTGLGR